MIFMQKRQELSVFQSKSDMQVLYFIASSE